MARTKDNVIHNQFEEMVIPGRREPTLRCRHCQSYERAKCRLQAHKDHLASCKPYILSQNQLEVKLEVSPSSQLVSKAQLDRMAAEAILYSGLPFNTFDRASHPAMAGFLNALNPSWPIPSRQRIARQLLDDIYCRVKSAVESRLSHEKLLNFTCDESNANNGDRVYNLSVNVLQGGSYHLKVIPLKALSANADNLVVITKEEILRLTTLLDQQYQFQQIPRINSLATDTCETMRSLHRKLRTHAEFKHTFFVPCDSHGLQLLVKDILGIGYWREIMKHANTIAVYFKRAKRALGILREIMDEIHERSSFTLAVITRWGSHYGVVRGLLRAAKPLRQFGLNNEAATLKASTAEVSKMAKVTRRLLNSGAFWSQLEQLEQLLRPIHRAQIQSEADGSTISLVIDRWQFLRTEIVAVCDAYQHDNTTLLAAFEKRFERQTSPIHWAAKSLVPSNAGCVLKFPPNKKREAEIFFREHCNPDEWPRLIADLRHFHERDGPFSSSQSDLWDLKERPKDFWFAVSDVAPTLYSMARRLISTPANSVPSERSFSAMNYIQN